MAKLLDANLIIRYFLDDDHAKADAVEQLLASGEELWLPDVVIAEIVWVLASYYKLSRFDIAERIESLISLKNIKANKLLIFTAISYYCEFNLDWVDAYLAAYARENRLAYIYSYDQDFDKLKQIKRVEPEFKKIDKKD
jgi:predicted nucleic acid-binding protein